VAAACTYAQKADGKSSKQSNPRVNAEAMRQRINRLESSILSMISGDAAIKHPGLTCKDRINLDQTGGPPLSLDTRSTHWDAILNDVSVSLPLISENTSIFELDNHIV
jgi:hypothetical protein